MELWNTKETELSTTLLALPAAAHPDQGPGRFLAFTQMLSKSLLVFGTDQVTLAFTPSDHWSYSYFCILCSIQMCTLLSYKIVK